MNIILSKYQWAAILTIAFLLALVSPLKNSYSQNVFRIEDKIGGGGSSGTVQTDNSDNTLLYVAAGALVAGVVVYAVLLNKKKKEKPDTTASANGLNNRLMANSFDDFNSEVTKAKDNIPINVFLGIKDEKTFKGNKTYLMGVSIKF